MTGQNPLDAHLAKSSRNAALLTGLGAVIMFAALGYGIYMLIQLDNSLQQKKAEEASLSRQIDVLRENTEQYRKSLRAIDQIAVRSRVPEAKLARKVIPLEAVVTPHAASEPAKVQHESSGAGPYNFSLWIEVPADRLQEIREVEYVLNHPSLQDQSYKSSDASRGFRISYEGAGCLSRVIINIFLSNGEKMSLDFDMCKNLGFS